MVKVISTEEVEPTFQDVKKWYEDHLHPDSNEYDNQDVYEYVYHKGSWGGIFQCTSAGSQRFFKRAKPRSIIDIAALTSIYRPGPLSANVDKLWTKHKDEPYDWGHPLLNESLKETRGLLIFQEQVMQLAEKIGGFPPDQCDNVRRAIMKRDMSKGEQAIKEANEMEETFIQGAIKKGVPRSIAKEAYQRILWMSGYGFNVAHATAYAIDSYMCAWLMYHYQNEWLCSYLESMSKNDVSRSKAFAEVRSLGYEIVPIDIKHATSTWTIIFGKKMMPAITACKGVGLAAAEELEGFRPFDSLEELFWDENGKWRPSKLNKRALEALIHVEAFGTLGCVGKDRLFNNYKHMERVIIDHMNEIKKSTKKDPMVGIKRFHELIEEYSDVEPYTKEERVKNAEKHFGTVDTNMLIDRELVGKLAIKGVRSIDEYSGTDVYWFIVNKVVPKMTKNNRKYLLIETIGPSNHVQKMFLWSWDGLLKIPKYSFIVTEVSKSEFGFSSSLKKNIMIESNGKLQRLK